MTRINVLQPEELSDIHLLAEYRELPRVFALAKAFKQSGKKEDFPSVYTLGSGHVKFFYNKLLWLANRQQSLVNELEKRGFNPTFKESYALLNDMPQDYCNDYLVTNEAIEINKERINLRLKEYELKMQKKIKNKSTSKTNEKN